LRSSRKEPRTWSSAALPNCSFAKLGTAHAHPKSAVAEGEASWGRSFALFLAGRDGMTARAGDAPGVHLEWSPWTLCAVLDRVRQDRQAARARRDHCRAHAGGAGHADRRRIRAGL